MQQSHEEGRGGGAGAGGVGAELDETPERSLTTEALLRWWYRRRRRVVGEVGALAERARAGRVARAPRALHALLGRRAGAAGRVRAQCAAVHARRRTLPVELLRQRRDRRQGLVGARRRAGRVSLHAVQAALREHQSCRSLNLPSSVLFLPCLN